MTQKAAHGKRMAQSLEELQLQLSFKWIDHSLPADWNALDYHHPLEPEKTRVTLRLDADMLRWFRKLGPGYQARINLILRIYWTALLSGNIHSRYQDDTLPRFKAAAREMLDQHGALMKDAGYGR